MFTGLGPQPSQGLRLAAVAHAPDRGAQALEVGSRPLAPPARPQVPGRSPRAGTSAPGGCHAPGARWTQGLGSLHLARCVHMADCARSSRGRAGGMAGSAGVVSLAPQTRRSRLRTFVSWPEWLISGKQDAASSSHSLVHSFTHSLTHSFTHSLTHSFAHSADVLPAVGGSPRQWGRESFPASCFSG